MCSKCIPTYSSAPLLVMYPARRYTVGVPRVWEKVRDSIQHEFERLTGIKEKMVSLSRGVDRRRSVSKMKGVQDKSWSYWLADM